MVADYPCHMRLDARILCDHLVREQLNLFSVLPVDCQHRLDHRARSSPPQNCQCHIPGRGSLFCLNLCPNFVSAFAHRLAPLKEQFLSLQKRRCIVPWRVSRSLQGGIRTLAKLRGWCTARRVLGLRLAVAPASREVQSSCTLYPKQPVAARDSFLCYLVLDSIEFGREQAHSAVCLKVIDAHAHLLDLRKCRSAALVLHVMQIVGSLVLVASGHPR